jgi:hypothetical protein
VTHLGRHHQRLYLLARRLQRQRTRQRHARQQAQHVVEHAAAHQEALVGDTFERQRRADRHGEHLRHAGIRTCCARSRGWPLARQ